MLAAVRMAFRRNKHVAARVLSTEFPRSSLHGALTTHQLCLEAGGKSRMLIGNVLNGCDTL